MKYIILLLVVLAMCGCQSRYETVAMNQHELIRMPNGQYQWVYSGPCWMDPDTDGP